MSRLIPLLLVLALLAGTGLSQNQLATPGTFNNADAGIMFDVGASTDLRITGFELYLHAGLHTIEIYRVTDGSSLVGRENDPNAWTLVGSVVVSASGAPTPTHLPCALEIAVPNGATQGLYLTARQVGGQVRYQNGTNFGGIDVANTDLVILEGVGKGYPFGATYGTPSPGGASRKFRGVIHYAAGLLGAEQSASTFAVPDDSEESITFDVEALTEDLIVTGLSANLLPGTHDLQLYVTEKYENDQAAGPNLANWRLVGSVTGFVAPGGKVRLPMDFEAIVPRGQLRGFYLVTSHVGGIEFENAQYGGTSPKLKIYTGETYLGTFGTQVGGGMIDATVHYRVPDQGFGITAGGTAVMSNSDNGPFFDVGIFFNVKSTKPVVIESLDYKMNAGNHTVEVWALTGGGDFVGQEANPSAWTRISSESVNVATTGKVQVAQDLRLFIPEGGVQGLYVTATSNAVNAVWFDFDPLVSGDFATDGTLTLTVGRIGDYPFIPQQVLGPQPDVDLHYRHLGSAPGGFLEDFASASGIEPPTGWISSFVTGNREKLDGWRFDNPGGRTINTPLSAPIAICDTDESGSGNPVAAALVSPVFDASVGVVNLDFDHHFRQYLSSVATVEVWDGTSWNAVATFTSDTANPAHASFDLTAAAGGSSEAMIRFRYTGDYDWWWMIDNVHLQIGQQGQRPQLGIGEFDINDAVDGRHGQPVSSGLPGPYVATADVFSPTVFSWDGEPNQPIQLFVGNLNLGNVKLYPQGQLDVGSYDPVTMTFPGILLLADGTANDLLNAAFRTSNGGRLVMPFYLPPYTTGQTYHFQSVVYSSTQNIALTNVVTLSIQ